MEQENMVNSKAALIEVFGDEVGAKLYGAAVKMSIRYGIDVDDVAQDIAEAALHIQAEYGYVNINIAINHAKNALFQGYNYGVNQYYTMRHGITTVSADQENENGDTLIETLEDTFTFVSVDLRMAFADFFGTLDSRDQTIITGLLQGDGVVKIAEAAGCSPGTVSNRKKSLYGQFAQVIA